jgi:hypothetical protein
MAEIIGSDSVVTGGKNVVEKMLADIPGGLELDLTDVTTEYDSDGYIPEGTPIILDAGDYKPLLAADLVADGAKVIGILYQEVPKAKPYASICIRGVVNEAKLPFAINATVKGALPGISFI